MLRTPESLEKYLAEDELKLYRLIWMRFVASQMKPAVFDQTTIDINANWQERSGLSVSAPPAACRNSMAS